MNEFGMALFGEREKKMTFSNKTFCTMPWSSIMILPSGDFKICCFTGHKTPAGGDSHGVAIDDAGNTMNVLTHSIKEAMNSKWHKELRVAQSQGKRHDICKVCWDRDDAAVTHENIATSLRVVRTYYQNADSGTNQSRETMGGHPMTGAVLPETASGIMTADGSIDMMPISLDMRFSNLCNAKCIMCEPLYSTLWYGDQIDVNQKDFFDVGPKRYNIITKTSPTGRKTYTDDMPNWNDDPRWWKQFDELAPHLRHVYITGGEPFIQPIHDVFIEKLVERGFAKNIIIEYDTNLSVLNPKILNYLTEFKDVIIRISADDVGERYNLVRFPLKFDRITKNIELLKEYGLHEKIVNITSCIGIHTIFAPLTIHRYFSSLGYDKYVFRILRAPPQVDIVNLPRAAKEAVIKIYEQSDVPHSDQKHVVGYLKNNLDSISDEKARNQISIFRHYMDSLDRSRGTDWRATIPEVDALIAKF